MNVNEMNNIEVKSKKDIEAERKAEQIRLSEKVRPEVDPDVARIGEIEALEAELKAEKDALKEKCETKFKEVGLVDFSNNLYSVIFHGASSVRSVDLTAMQKNDPDLYETVFSTYGKTTPRSEGYSWRKAKTKLA